MPDMHLDDNGRVILGPDPTPDPTPVHLDPDPEVRAQAIANCGICDDDGYRGVVICDHVDRTEIAKRGAARCREALAAKQLKIEGES